MKVSMPSPRENFRENSVPLSPEEEVHGWEMSITTSPNFALRIAFKVCTKYLAVESVL